MDRSHPGYHMEIKLMHLFLLDTNNHVINCDFFTIFCRCLVRITGLFINIQMSLDQWKECSSYNHKVTSVPDSSSTSRWQDPLLVRGTFWSYVAYKSVLVYRCVAFVSVTVALG